MEPVMDGKASRGLRQGCNRSQVYYCRCLEEALKGVLPLASSTPHYDVLLLVGHSSLMDPDFPPPCGLCILGTCLIAPCSLLSRQKAQ